MDRVMMPEIVTPALADMIAGNPDILKMLVGNNSGEEVIIGQNCTLDCSGNPAIVKLVLCNVTIGLDEAAGHDEKSSCSGDKEEKSDSIYISTGNRDNTQNGVQSSNRNFELNQLQKELAVLETKVSVLEHVIRLIPRHVFTRKVVAHCKRDLNEALEQLTAKRKTLLYRTWIMQSEE